jgi:hypothetical protein
MGDRICRSRGLVRRLLGQSTYFRMLIGEHVLSVVVDCFRDSLSVKEIGMKVIDFQDRAFASHVVLRHIFSQLWVFLQARTLLRTRR